MAGILVLRGVVAQVLGRRENGESELNTWRSAAIFRDGISINVNLCQYANYRRSARITGMPGRSGEGTAGRRLGMLRMPELNTWRSARKHVEP